MTPDRALDQFVAHQYGAFSVSQAYRVGFTKRMVHRRLASGAWIRLASGVYALASAPPKWERQMAASLLTRPGSIVAGRAAGHLHGFEGFGPTRPVVMVGTDGNARSPLARVIRSQRFGELATVRRRGFPVTSEAETIMTLARDLDPDRLEALVDWVLARGGCTVTDLVEVVAASSGVVGVGILRPIIEYRLPDAYQPPTSALERLLYPILDDPRIPPVARQVPMVYRRVSATVDAFIELWRLIIEGDGRRWHTRKDDMERDRIRDNEATAHGLAVLRFGWAALRDRPDDVLDTILRTGRVRQAS